MTSSGILNRPAVAIAFFLCAFLTLSAIASAAEVATMKDGRVGEIVITKEVRAGGHTLQPGKYKVQHRVHGEQHLMHFTPVDDPDQELTAEVECEVDPKNPRWRRSSAWFTVKDGATWIEKIMVQGEKIVYNFK